ncbi:MAG: hypothetical protein OES46_03540 [Gammaproteobacteria bacterium]|jgi:hypothetical protein|nr:hypothetical protein [Gammaproteobacteria bacterium]
MNRIIQLTCLLLIAVLAAGCAVWARIDEPLVDGPDKAFQLELPVGWIRAGLATDRVLVTRDGTGVQFIEAMKRTHKKAFSDLKEETRADMLPTELAELAIAQLKSQPGVSDLEVVNNAPATIAGTTGFRLHVQMKNSQGLAYEAVVYGFVDADGFYRLRYQAPSLHYFKRDLSIFERAVKSFRLTGERA